MIGCLKNKVSFYALLGTVFGATIFVLPMNAMAANPLFQKNINISDFQRPSQLQHVQYNDPRINDLEQKVRELNGTVEILNHKINEMQEEIKRLGGQAQPTLSEQAPSSSQPNPEDIAQNNNKQDNNQKDETPHLQGLNLGTLKLDQTGDVTGSTMDPNSNNQLAQYGEVLETVPETATPEELLILGTKYLNAHNYKAAESIFSIFAQLYPESELNGDATFYLGDALSGQGRHREAAQRYLAFYNEYPESKRQPENLLKLAKSLSALNDRSVACETLSSISQKYQTIDPDILKAIKEEQKQNKCQ